MGSRFANRVYLNLGTAKVVDFDELFALVANIRWKEYINSNLPIIVDASSSRSILTSVPTIQSIWQKAIFESWVTSWKQSGIQELHILILIIDDTARILLDVTGEALHKRGYRTEQGEAPIKETLAAWLVAMSGWRYKEPLWDPCCGSGTLAIEAALMARNIAPGLGRKFRFMDLPFYEEIEYENIKEDLQEKEFVWKYTITASDRDPEIIAIAKRNALRAWVRENIHFECEDFVDTDESRWTIVTNPPYGNRLKDENLGDLYTKLIHEVQKNGWWFITSFPVDVRHGLANKKLLNGNEECRFWYKKDR
jgi:putative N6-adenine-specific DNA methylase